MKKGVVYVVVFVLFCALVAAAETPPPPPPVPGGFGGGSADSGSDSSSGSTDTSGSSGNSDSLFGTGEEVEEIAVEPAPFPAFLAEATTDTSDARFTALNQEINALHAEIVVLKNKEVPLLSLPLLIVGGIEVVLFLLILVIVVKVFRKKKELPQQLVTYITQYKQYPLASIKQQLLKQGWSAKEIEKVYKKVHA
jgi:hypothetical protein